MLLLPGVLLLLASCRGQEYEEYEYEYELCEDGAYPDPDQCDLYWECRGGQLTSHLCPDGLVYDETTSVASFQVGRTLLYRSLTPSLPHQVGTGAPPSDGSRCSYPFAIDCTDRPSLQPPQPKENCPNQNGYFAVPGTCDKYWFCSKDR